MTNYAIRKQKFCLKRDKSLRMGFCRKDPPIEDVFGSYKLEKKRSNWGRTWQLQTWKKKENKLRFPSPSPTPEIMEEATATSFPGFSPTRFTERGREREEERGREGERERERTWERGWSRGGRCTFFPFITFDTRVNKTNFKAMKKSAIFFFTSTQPCQDQNKNRIQECNG